MASMVRIVLAAILLALLMGIGGASKHHLRQKHGNQHNHEYSSTSSGPFQIGQEYLFHYDVQTTSGYAPWISTQNAVGRMQADVRIQFTNSNRAVLRLEGIQDGELHSTTLWNTAEIMPMNMFEKANRTYTEINEITQCLEYPVEFSYNNGIVSNIRFNQNEQTWSKNIKKAILSLIQISMKPIKQIMEKESSEETEKSFMAWETSVEGECETLYVLSKVKNNNDLENKIQRLNVTQSINFDRCNSLADIAYGMQMENTGSESKMEMQGSMQMENTMEMQGSMQMENIGSESKMEIQDKFGRVVPSNKLQRSSVCRYQLTCEAESCSKSEYGIDQVELVSEYSLKSLNAESKQTQQTIVSSKLVFIESNEKQHRGRNEKFENEAETLLYSAEVETFEKLFIMHGDEKYSNVKQLNSLERRAMHQNEAEDLIEEMVQNLKVREQEEVDILENVEKFNRLVEIMRFSTVPELQSLQQKCRSENKQIIFLDGLSVAASRNTIKVLVDLIRSDSTIDQLKAARVVKNLGMGSGLPAPSDTQINLLLGLCKSSDMKGKEVLRQSCWLTLGSMLRELVEQSRKNQEMKQVSTPMNEDVQSINDKMKLYNEVLIGELNKATNDYEKILCLKAIGNAGAPNNFQVLKDLIQNQDESSLIRMHAIEAMHYLVRDPEIGFKVRNALMPVFSNVNEAKQVRLAAIQQILQCCCDVQIKEDGKAQGGSFVDQIIYVLNNEKSEEVIQFVYSLLESKIETPCKWERDMVMHLKNALKQIQPELWENRGVLGSPKNIRMPWFSKENNEGVFVDITSVLPNHISLGLDTLINGEYQRDSLKISLCQRDMEQLLREWIKEDESNENLEAQTSGTTQNGFFKNAAQQLRSIFTNLKIKTRKNGRQPFALLSMKYNNMDMLLLPITEEVINGQTNFKNIVNNIASSWQQLTSQRNNIYQLNAIVPMFTRQANVPTSSGMPLRIRQQTLLTTKMQAQINLANKMVGFNPDFSVTHIQEINVNHIPKCQSGVSSQRTISLQLPLQVKLNQDNKNSEISVEFKIPQKKVRLLTVETLPITFIYTCWPLKRTTQTVCNEELENQQRSLEMTFGAEVLNLPITIEGHYHVPRDVTSLKEIVRVLMTSENELRVDFKPNRETPEKIVLTASLDWFAHNTKSPATSFHSMMQDFYTKFQSRFFTQNNDESDSSIQMKISNSQTYLSKFNNVMNYKHSVTLKVETVGGRRNVQADLTIAGVCDARLRMCEAQVDCKRSALLGRENSQWAMSGTIRTLYPEHVNSMQELESKDTKTQQKFFAQVDLKWGGEQCERQRRGTVKSMCNYLKMNVEGRPNKKMLHHVSEMLKLHESQNRYRQNQDSEEISETFKTHIQPFINQYDFAVDYKCDSTLKDTLSEYFEVFKGLNFWNIKSRESMTSIANSHKPTDEGMVLARFTIDPINPCYANLSVETSTERVHLQNVEMPCEMKPMKLVRDNWQKSNVMEIHSGKQWVSKIASNLYTDKNAECRVDGKRVKTFDGVTHNVPTSKCFTVLAKDCSSENDPKFAVLMKTVKGTEEQKLKVITPRFLIECEPWTEKVLDVKVNGQMVHTRGQTKTDLSRFDMAVERDQQGREWMIVENEYVTVKFNGMVVKIQLTDEYKNLPCGLCGNYNDEVDDEWEMNNDEQATNIKSLHQSYTIQEDSECSSTEHKKFYQQSFEDNQIDSSEDRENKKNQMEPVMQTLITEYNHKICFSMKTVRQCPKGWYAVENGQMLRREKVMFTCLDRDSIQAKRIRKVLRRHETPTELAGSSISFVESIQIPQRCIQY